MSLFAGEVYEAAPRSQKGPIEKEKRRSRTEEPWQEGREVESNVEVLTFRRCKDATYTCDLLRKGLEGQSVTVRHTNCGASHI